MYSMLRLGNLDIYNTEKVYEAIFNFQIMKPFNAQFSLAGYESTNFVIESGTLLIGTVLFLLYQVIRLMLVKIVKSDRFRERENWLTKRIKRN